MNPICLGFTKLYNSPFYSLGVKSGDTYSVVSPTLHWRLIAGRLIAFIYSVGTGGRFAAVNAAGVYGLITKF